MSNPNSTTPRGRPRAGRMLAALVATTWIGLIAWAQIDVAARGVTARSAAKESLQARARTAQLLFRAEEDAASAALEALRSALRAEGILGHPARLRARADPDQEQGQEKDEADAEAEARRLARLLERGLSDSERLVALELVVADQAGLWVWSFVRDGAAVRERPIAESEREGVAKALWYAEATRRAVASAGRRVEHGEIAFEGEIERARRRLAIGLHHVQQVQDAQEAQDLVQGALVASADLTRLSGSLASLAGEAERVTLVTSGGRALDPSIAARRDASRLRDLRARALAGDGPLEPFEADGQLVLGVPVADSAGGLTDLLLLIETPAPAVGLAAWQATPWPISLAGLSIVSSLAIAALLRRPVRSDGDSTVSPASDIPARARDEEEPAASASVASSARQPASQAACVTPRAFALREWLSDVRGCLEREAATRGLGFALRCERSLPDEALADPDWLGGLLVAMGREALDAAADHAVAFEVCEEAGETLRFELDAGDMALAPTGGMHAAAARVGARLEPGREGRLALIVPAMLA